MKQITDSNKLAYYLKKYDFGSFMPNEVLDKLELLLFKKDEYICRTNEKLGYLYFFVDGKAKAYTILANGKSFLHAFCHDFEVLGEVEFTTGQFTFSNVQAITDTYCISISLEQYGKVLLANHTFLHYIAYRLAYKLENVTQKDSVNLCYPLENRLASYMINTADNLLFKDNLMEVSELLATSYRHLLRTLQNFCKEGYLTKTDAGYKIIRDADLQELGKYVY